MRHNRLGQILAILSVAMQCTKHQQIKKLLYSHQQQLILVSHLCTQFYEEILFFDKIICGLLSVHDDRNGGN